MGKAEHGAGHIGERLEEQACEAALSDGTTGMKSDLRSVAERILRRFLRVWFLISRAHTLGVRGAAYDESGRVFLVKHTYVAGWHLPGGGVEIGESFHAALLRELAEEGNLSLGDPAELFGVYHNANSSRRDHVALYVCRNIVQVTDHEGDSEIADSGFFFLDDLPDGVTPATGRRLAEISGKTPPSLDW